MSELVAEIVLEHVLLALDATSLESEPGERVVVAGDVLAEIAAARARGVRALLVSIDSCGGDFAAGAVLYDAFRTFSDAGGAVVVYVSDFAASAAVLPVLGGDYIVAPPFASIWPHGARTDDWIGLPGDPDRSVSAVERLTGAVLRAHTLAGDLEIARWLEAGSTADDPGGEQLWASRAHELGFVDFIGDGVRARAIARDLASGEQIVQSDRRASLAARGRRPDVDQVLREVRGVARTHVAMRGWSS